MRVRAVLLAAAVVLVASPAYADHIGDRNCGDFQYQEDAQAHMNAHPGDPDNLDADNDGEACETLPRRGSGGVGTPVGGVDAGAGGSATGTRAVWLLAAGATLLVVGGALRRVGRRSA